jgi:hypothetical protein
MTRAPRRHPQAWAKQQARAKPDIRLAVLAGSWGGLLYTGVLYAISIASQLVGPMMLQQIVSGLSCFSAQAGGAPITCPTQDQLYM